eukprot:362917-Chlamydomonas_euryale.AAC.6
MMTADDEHAPIGQLHMPRTEEPIGRVNVGPFAGSQVKRARNLAAVVGVVAARALHVEEPVGAWHVDQVDRHDHRQLVKQLVV